MQDVTRYLFLHGHILQQRSPDSMRAFPGFPPWTKSWSARSKTSQTDCGVHCVLPLCCHCAATPPLGHQRKRWNFLPPYMTSHPGRLMSPGTPPLITHKAVPPPPRIHWNWPAVLLGTVWQLSTFNSPSLQFASEISVASCSWLIMWTNMGFLWRINKSNGLSNCMERLS